MRCDTKRVLVTIILVWAYGCTAPPTYKQPPVGSHATSERQVKIGESPTSVQGAMVTLDFFRIAEVRPLLGRFFIDADSGSSSRSVVVLSHDLWAERFGSSPTIIGRDIELDGRHTTVVGVAPPGFGFPEGTLLWTPKSSGAP
jgi:hypothetical protein